MYCDVNMVKTFLVCLGDVVQVIGSVLDTEDDEEGHLVALHIIHDLMIKSKGSIFVSLSLKILTAF